jgi:hypothetical protein
MSQYTIFSLIFNEDSKMGLPFLYLLYHESYSEKQKNTIIVRFGDYYLNITLWGQSYNFFTLR